MTPAELTVTAQPQTYVYNGSAQGPAGTYTSDFDTYVTVVGLMPGDELTSVTVSGSQTNAGVYPTEILPSDLEIGTATSNYSITYVPASLTITPILTITATSDKTPACQVKTLTGTIVVKDLTVSATGSKSNCDNKSGSASVTASNGFEPYTYSYAYKYPSATHNTNVNLTDVNNLNTPNPTGLDTAVYVVTVTDANGCSKTAEFTVGLTNNLTVEVSAEPQHICSGGSFVITPTAPAGTHYSWNPPAQNPA